ncbi:unnamed protein product [Orchesella dallaii]|uniref:Ionotropic glutamate receptor L-glutamate and glycine-binding domain-containing protein n=1 Tax=Orchesella dallaii TaxID=48710 RepID=A0ABP1Q7Q3_9HEXA
MEILIVLVILFQNFLCHSFNTQVATQIASSHFTPCSVIILTLEHDPGDVHEISKFSLELQQKSEAQSQISSIYLLGLNSMKEFSGLSDLRRLTSYCKLIITFVTQENVPNGRNYFNPETFFNLLTSREYPITRRDEDHYIFLTRKPSLPLASFILQSELGRELKFKLLILPQGQILTYCLFCERTLDSQEKSIIDIKVDLTNKNNNSSLSALFPDFTKNFHEHPIRVVGPTKYVSLYEMELINGKYEHKRGFFTEFFKTMQKKLNFTYILRPCSGFGSIIAEGNTGVRLKNGTWAGCVGDIYNRAADLSLGASPSEERLHFVEFTNFMRYDYIMFFAHKPQVIYPWTVVFVAFDIYGWICVALSILLAAFILYETEVLIYKSTLSRISINIYDLSAYLVGQGIPTDPLGISSKVTYVSWLYYGMVIGAAYACSLQSLIVSPGMSVIPTTMPELVTSNFLWGVPVSFKNGLGWVVFRNADNEAMRTIYNNMHSDKDALRCLEKAATSDYVCFHWLIMVEFYIGTRFTNKAGNHPFLYAKDNVLFSGPTWVTRKKEIFRGAFNDFFARQFSMGVVLS